jgi:transposase
MEYFQSDEIDLAKFSSQSLSEMFRKIGANKKAIRAFQNSWLDQNRVQTGVFYDITSFSSYAKRCDLVEWGYNRDGDDLPQIIALVKLPASNLG